MGESVDKVCGIIYRMSEAHSKASKANWAGVSKEERSKRMRAVVRARWAKLSAQERREWVMRRVIRKTH